MQAEAAEDMMKQGITFFPGAVTSDGRRIRRWDVLWAVYNQAFTYFELVQQRNAKLQQLQKTFEAAVCFSSLHVDRGRAVWSHFACSHLCSGHACKLHCGHV